MSSQKKTHEEEVEDEKSAASVILFYLVVSPPPRRRPPSYGKLRQRGFPIHPLGIQPYLPTQPSAYLQVSISRSGTLGKKRVGLQSGTARSKPPPVGTPGSAQALVARSVV